MSKEAFVSQYQDIANKAGEQLGVAPMALLAQWGLETGWGKSIIPGTNNLGNIKDFSGKGTEATDNATGSRDKYRTYGTPDEFVNDYVSLVKRKYPAAMGQQTAVGFASALKAGGYAEDPAYVQKIADIAGEAYVPAQGSAAKPVPKGGIKKAYEDFIDQGVQASVVRPKGKPLFDTLLEQANFERAIQEEARPTGWESFGAAVAGNTQQRIVNGIVEHLFSPTFAPVEGFKPDLKNLPLGADADVIEAFNAAKSPQEAEHVLTKYEDEQMRLKAVGEGGMGNAILRSLAAEGVAIPNYVAPMAAARALNAVGKGSIALAQAGRSGASVASAVGENILSGSALEAIAQGSEGKFKPTDLMVSLAADTLMGVGFGLAGVKAAQKLIEGGVKEGAIREATHALKAQEALGPNATPSELRAAMDNALSKDVNDVLDSVKAPAETKLIKELPVQADAKVAAQVAALPEAKAAFDAPSSFVAREAEFAKGGVHEAEIAARTNGLVKDLEGLKALAPGQIHATDRIPLSVKPAMDTTIRLARKLLGEDYIITLDAAKIALPDGRFGNADIVQVTDKIAMIRVDPDQAPTQIVRSVVHEVGHAIFNKHISKVAPEQRAKLVTAFNRFLEEAKSADPSGHVARDMRFSLTNMDRAVTKELTPKLKSPYELNWDEFSAEQFVKFVEGDIAGENKLGLHRGTVAAVKEAIQRAIAFLTKAKRADLGVTNEYKEFFENLMANPEIQAGAKAADGTVPIAPLAQASVKPAEVVNELLTDPDAAKFGINLAPVNTPLERKQAQIMLALHKQAEQWAVKNPMDAAWIKRADNLADNNVFNVASTGLRLLKSESPLVRMLASELLEDASGVAGKRRATASISKYITERMIMGNTIPDINRAYGFWKANKGGGLWDDMIGGHNWAAFNKELSQEIEARRLTGAPVTQDANIKNAVDSIEAAYQRSANEQRRVGTLGADGLPKTSVGYMPHKMSPKAVMQLTNEQTQILHGALTDQFITIEGWDPSMADKVATNYIKRVRDRASGDYSSVIGGNSGGAADIVEQSLRDMAIPEEAIAKHMESFTKGGANYTKGRIELDLNKVYSTSNGEFRLLDIFETNQIELLRSQAGRASGEIALTKYGVQGKPGLKLLRDAMQYGQDGAKASVKEKEAFDQIASEFMNEPFGTKTGRWMERAMSANTLVRLGGMAFNQFAESINGIYHVGAMRTMESIGSIGRLTKEIDALVKGEHVDNPFLTSIEHASGAEFGTDSYKMVMPFDSPDHAFPTYGQDTLTLTDRLLRGGGHLQAKLSGWKLIHSAQQRGMAEQIVHKMMRYVREGKDDIALDQFGIHSDIRKALRDDLDKIATFEGDRLMRFDVTKISDPNVREEVIQAVWRGTQQIIQGTFIGERGKWAHDGWMKIMSQFRTFGLTSMEKQWGRQRNSHGDFAAFGMLVGSMSIAAPVYMARVYASSIGRPDQQEYLQRRLEPQAVARATLNFVAMSGMLNDFIDLGTSVLPDDWGVKPSGGRPGVETDFVGNFVAPSSSLVNDIWKYAQSPTKVENAVKILPGSRLPYLIPFLNETKH